MRSRPEALRGAASPARKVIGPELLRNFTGSCHCGDIGFAFQTALPVVEWPVHACQCRFCRVHAALTLSDAGGRLAFRVADVASLERYRFGLQSADFLLCNRCGVYVGAQINTAAGAFGMVNIRAMTPVPSELPAAVATKYDSETAPQRTARRAQRWTPLEKII